MASELSTTLGVMEIGVIIGSILFGINILQIFLYFRNFPGDRWGLKVLVASVCILEVIHTVFLIESLYYYTVQHFGDPNEFIYDLPVFNVAALLTGFITFMVQGFFSWRVYAVTQSPVTAGLCGFLAFGRFGFSLAGTGKALALHNFVAFGSKFRWPVAVSVSFGAASDILIASTLCYTLNRSRSGIERTDKIVDKLIAYTMSTGLLTSMLSVSELICFLTLNNFVWLAQLIVTSKIFSNSLLASLNARASLRDDRHTKSTFTTTPVRIAMDTVTTSDQSFPKHHERDGHTDWYA